MPEKLTQLSQEQETKKQELFSLPKEYDNICTVETSNTDSEGFVRPVFRLEGSDEKYIFLGYGQDRPIELISQTEVKQINATPEGLLEEAIRLRPDDPKFEEMLVNIRNNTYTTDEIILLDDISAAISVDDESKFTVFDQTEGFALVLSALIGNDQARELLDRKLELYYENIEFIKNKSKEENKRELDGVEPTSWDKIAFVHSTRHQFERDDDGTVELRPYGHHVIGSDKSYPRATIHFTVNSVVESHLAGSWENSNSLIVTSGDKIVSENGNPSSMNVIDTYWSTSPGEALVLKEASVITPISGELEYLVMLDSRGLLDRTQPEVPILIEDAEHNDVYYLLKKDDEYTDSDHMQILQLDDPELFSLYSKDSLSLQRRIDNLKGREAETLGKIALGRAMRQQGIQSSPVKLEQWSSNDRELDKSFMALAGDLGVRYGIHEGAPHEIIEKSTFTRGLYTDEDPHSRFNFGELDAHRWLVAGGFIRTIKQSVKQETLSIL